MLKFDARLTPARGDVAAAHLKGAVEAQRFVEGRLMTVNVGIAALRAAAQSTSRLETQLFFGERFTVYDVADGWAWGQSALDDYVGYVEVRALTDANVSATHRVTAVFTQIYEGADVKAPARLHVPMNAKLAVAPCEGKFAALAGGGFVPRAHVAPLNEAVDDFVAVAEELLGVPYLWGGRAPDGIDCSGLVQSSLERTCIWAPRDSDLQEKTLGEAVAGTSPFKRGDLVFWADHVGIMSDARTLLHANSHHMKVAKEPLDAVIARAKALGNAVTSVRRF